MGIWGTQDLLTSFDGINIFRPWHYGFQKTFGGWFHVDQGRTKEGLHAVQGFVSLYDQHERTGGLVVVPGSHKRHAEVIASAEDDRDFVALTEEDPILRMRRQLVTCQAGDLVLW